ncbi:hypothetical protein WKN98_001635 [Escherichia coli]|nr:hypothetical protein AFK66_021175 [Cronobacter malonaticus LMG 23826]
MLIAEALSVKERYSGVSWEEMKEDDQAMYQCAMQRLSYLQSIPKKHTHLDRKLPDWPSNPHQK